MSIFQNTARTITTTILDYDEDEKAYEMEISGKIDDHEVVIDGKIEDISDEYIARVEAWFCWYIVETFYGEGKGHGHNVDKSRWEDFAEQSGVHGARIRSKQRRRR